MHNGAVRAMNQYTLTQNPDDNSTVLWLSRNMVKLNMSSIALLTEVIGAKVIFLALANPSPSPGDWATQRYFAIKWAGLSWLQTW